MRVGIVSGEFLAPGVSRTGGFGWAAVASAAALRAAGDEPVLVCPDVTALPAAPRALDGVPLIAKRDARSFARALRAARLHALLTIDYRPSYASALRILPRTPLIVWVRDPRTPQDAAAVAATRLPGAGDDRPPGTGAIDCTGIRAVTRWARVVRRGLTFASPSPEALGPKIAAAYGHDPGAPALLPNPLDARRVPGPKSPAPRVAFLGRLDPLKRPWLFTELARDFPQAEFVLIGDPHFDGGWSPAGAPANVRVAGGLTGEAKLRELDAAWVVVNTSVHEGLPVSLQEALAARTPLLACIDTERVVSRFGICAGQAGGDGLAALPRLRAGLARLLADHDLRGRLGADGREWVCSRHTQERFVAAFRELAAGIA